MNKELETYKLALKEKIEGMKKYMLEGKEYELNNFSRASYNSALENVLELLEE